MTAPLYPSEDLRKRLEELGVPRDKHNLAELGEMLPKFLTGYQFEYIRTPHGLFVITLYKYEKLIYSSGNITEANARASMVCYLKEKGLMK